MTNTGELPTEREFKMGQDMSFITFGELVKELTGQPFEVVFKDFLSEEGKNGSICIEKA